MVSDHKEDISTFKKDAEKRNDPQIRAWAKNKIPTLEHHLMMAEQAKKWLAKQNNQYKFFKNHLKLKK